jgi:predicted ATPase
MNSGDSRIKVALTGAHGTGKSTLAAAIIERLKGAVLVPEVPRLFVEELGEPERFQRGNNGFTWQTLLVARQIEIESTYARDAEILICDRSVVDHWAYTQILFPSECKAREGLAWKAMARRWAKTYQAVIHLPIEFRLEQDGVREPDDDFQQEVDEAIRSLYAEFERRTITIGGSLEARVDTLLSIIRGLSRP